MKILNVIMIIGASALFCASCKEKSTNADTPSAISFSSQSSKCLSKGLAKSSGLDSLFLYTFTDTLIIDFSVSANCCPDSNRFRVTQMISSDTIVIIVTDTANNNCRCICPYMIHAEFGNLSEDQYIVQCRMGNSSGIFHPIYLVNIDRKK